MVRKEDVIPVYKLKYGKVVELGDTITAISGDVVGAYTDLKGTFDVRQANIAQETKIEDNLKRLVELTKRQNKQVKEAQNKAERQAKTERNRFYVSTIIAVAAIIIALVAIFV